MPSKARLEGSGAAEVTVMAPMIGDAPLPTGVASVKLSVVDDPLAVN